MNFGNWMVMEGYMMNSSNQAPDQHTWKQKLTSLIGSSNTTTFYNAWLTNHVTQADINQLKTWGFNSVRVPLHYEYFVNAGTPDVWNDLGFTLLDNIIFWCSTAGTYTIEFRVANGNSANGTVQIQNADGTEVLASSTVPSTGSWSTWTTVSVTGGFWTAGLQGIRMVNTSGEYNVNSVNFVFQNLTIPTVVPVVPSQKVIILKGNNSKYVTFSGAVNLMTCTRATQGSTEEFTVVDAGNGLVALKGSNGKYVSVKSTNNLLYCNSSVIGTNEKFTMTDLCGALSLKGYNNLYVSSDNGATTGMPCNRTTAQAWEYFNWTYIRSNYINTDITDMLAAKGYKVFPNPAQNTINISLIPSALNRHTSVIIFDLFGRAVINTSLTGSNKSIDLSSIPDGVYLMRISESQKSISVKFIKAN